MLELKKYQTDALARLQEFLQRARFDASESALQTAFAELTGANVPYRSRGFEGIPYVCLRIPTGGGKTLMAAHAIAKAKVYVERDYPLVIWLVPTNTIRLQTCEALKKPGHPYNDALIAEFGDAVGVYDIEEVENIRQSDIGTRTLIVVSTLQTLRVENTAGRKVYAYHENFEPHFVGIPENLHGLDRIGEADLAQNPHLFTRAHLGRVKRSFVNLLYWHRPIVIVDEAHNARTPLTFDTLQRIRPACIIEWTATPNVSTANGSNLLFHVSAAELKAEHMIKLPIRLTEHRNGWEEAVTAAVETRRRLVKRASDDTDYIRPIVLFQTENKEGKVTVDVLKQYLLDRLEIPKDEIAVATGTQRELDGLDLLDRRTPVNYVITIEALKEGWDCSFAYVFCSVKNVSSSKDAEQLLGRVLRMPYAKERAIPELNQAYAHLVSPEFGRAANALRDKLIADMGFNEWEAAAAVVPDLWEDEPENPEQPRRPALPPLVLELPATPLLETLADEDRARIRVEPAGQGVKLSIHGDIGEELEQTLLNAATGKAQEETHRRIQAHKTLVRLLLSPAERGERFAPLPRVCVPIQGKLELVDPDYLELGLGNWSILTAENAFTLDNFNFQTDATAWTIDLAGKQVEFTDMDARQMPLQHICTEITASDLVRWLSYETRHRNLSPVILTKYLDEVIRQLLLRDGITLDRLVAVRYPLAMAIRQKIAELRDAALKSGFQTTLFADDSPIEISFDYGFEFKRGQYFVSEPYRIPLHTSSS